MSTTTDMCIKKITIINNIKLLAFKILILFNLGYAFNSHANFQGLIIVIAVFNSINFFWSFKLHQWEGIASVFLLSSNTTNKNQNVV